MAKVYAVFFEMVMDSEYDGCDDVYLEDIYADENSAKEAVKHRIQQRLEYMRDKEGYSIIESDEMGPSCDQKGYRIGDDDHWSGYFYQEYELRGGGQS